MLLKKIIPVALTAVVFTTLSVACSDRGAEEPSGNPGPSVSNQNTPQPSATSQITPQPPESAEPPVLIGSDGTIPYPPSFERPEKGNYENDNPLVVQKPWDIYDGVDVHALPEHTGANWHQTENLKRESVPFIETGETRNLSISFHRDWYGTAITSVKYDGWEYIYNAFAGTANMHGGGSLQSAFFYDAIVAHPETGAMTRVNQEYNNPIESHGIWILSNNPPTRGADAAFYLGKETHPVSKSSQTAVIQGTCQFWTRQDYIDWSDPMCDNRWTGRSPGDRNDQASDTTISKMYTLGWVGQVGNTDLYWPNVLVTDLAIQKPTSERVLSIDVLSGYHYDCEMPDYYEYDPRTGDHSALTMVYPYDTRMAASSYTAVAAAITNIDGPGTNLMNGYTLAGKTLVTYQYVLLTAQTDASENGIWKINDEGATKIDDDVAFPPELGQFLKYKAVYAGNQQWTLTKEGVWKHTINYGFLPQIVASEDGTRAMGMWTPQIPLPGDGGGAAGMYTRTRFNYTDINGWEIRMTPPTLGGEAEPPRYKAYLIVGSLEEVLTTMDEIYEKVIKVLSPSVFDWKYYRDSTLNAPDMYEEQVRLHWLCFGADAELTGKEGFDWGAKPEGMDNFCYLLSKVITGTPPAELLAAFKFDRESDWADHFKSWEQDAGSSKQSVSISGGTAKIEITAEPVYYEPTNAYYSRIFDMDCGALGMTSDKTYTIIMKYKASASPALQMFQTYDGGYGSFWPTWDALSGTGSEASLTYWRDGDWMFISYPFIMSGDDDLHLWLRAFSGEPLTGMTVEIGAIIIYNGVLNDTAAAVG